MSSMEEKSVKNKKKMFGFCSVFVQFCLKRDWDGTRTQNLLLGKLTLIHLAKLTKFVELVCYLVTYLLPSLKQNSNFIYFF